MHGSFRIFMVILLVGLFFPANVFAQIEGQTSQQFSQKKAGNISIALDGYDAVSYFMPAGVEKGVQAYQAVYQDKRYLFVSAENQNKFAADPEKYLPEFEDYCGCGVSENKRIKADPKVFKITEGKLVLFENTQALSKWNANETERFQKAQKFWKHENEYNANKRLQDDTRVRLFTF